MTRKPSRIGSLFFIAVTGILSACQPAIKPIDRVAQGYNADQVTALARQTLSGLQGISFKENREYCGIIGIDTNGQIRANKPSRGRSKSCIALQVPSDWKIIASYHTHGSYEPQVHSEVPSVQDVAGAASIGIIGYLSTPGGRFWIYDGKTKTAKILCGPGCLSQDPLYRQDRPVNRTYTIDQLAERQQGQY